MQDRPTAPELLDALAAMLFADVREWVPRERRFQVLVAANVAAVVGREIRAGAEPSVEDLRLFGSLLGGGEPAQPGKSGQPRDAQEAEREARELARRLAGRIRCGELDSSLDAVSAALREHVRRKLDIARPGYADAPDPPDA